MVRSPGFGSTPIYSRHILAGQNMSVSTDHKVLTLLKFFNVLTYTFQKFYFVKISVMRSQAILLSEDMPSPYSGSLSLRLRQMA